MATMKELHDAILAGGLVLDRLTLLTQRGLTGISVQSSVWEPNGRGRLVCEDHVRSARFEDDLVHELVDALALTDWARRIWEGQTRLDFAG